MKQEIFMDNLVLSNGTIISKEAGSMTILADKDGASLSMVAEGGLGPGGVDWHSAKYFICDIHTHVDHTVMFGLNSYSLYNSDKSWPDLNFGVGVLPDYPVRLCIPLSALKSGSLHVPRTPGRLTMYVIGKPVTIDELVEFSIRTPKCYHEVEFTISNLYLDDAEPEYLYPDKKLVDEMGQWVHKQWPEKMPSTDTMIDYLQRLLLEAKEFDFQHSEGFSRYGGWKKKNFGATGYFSRHYDGKRWWLVDPEGYAFISIGPDCIGHDRATYIPGLEHTLSWLPDREDERFAPCWSSGYGLQAGGKEVFDFATANLIRAYGDTWFQDWALTVKMGMYKYGFNTIGNWSDVRLYKEIQMPYVYQLEDFPATKKFIHRDFPDVFSEEYWHNAEKFAQQLQFFEGDEMLIGYFMRNEPTWAFAEGLIIAEEMLANPESFECKKLFIAEMKEKYGTIEAFNSAWNMHLTSFEDLNRPAARLSYSSKEAHDDLQEFSRKMIKAYVEVPAKACKAVDPHHLNLGMRWAMIHNLDLLAGSETIDVFSMNRYAETPVDAIESFMTRLDMPLLIGEFHIGALDKGLTATGHIATVDQYNRGLAYRYYVETALATKVCVGTHYFTYNDQSPIGRFDGENFQHGIMDVCQQPYEDFAAVMTQCNLEAYSVAAGEQPPKGKDAEYIPCVN
jgi:hypothetical protein